MADVYRLPFICTLIFPSIVRLALRSVFIMSFQFRCMNGVCVCRWGSGGFPMRYRISFLKAFGHPVCFVLLGYSLRWYYGNAYLYSSQCTASKRILLSLDYLLFFIEQIHELTKSPVDFLIQSAYCSNKIASIVMQRNGTNAIKSRTKFPFFEVTLEFLFAPICDCLQIWVENGAKVTVIRLFKWYEQRREIRATNKATGLEPPRQPNHNF